MKAREKTAEDRRVRRTRRALRDALVRLVLERGWDAVAVQDVCAAADVGRSTFYAHFADKENLLLSAFDDLHATLRQLDADEPFGFIEPLFEHAAQNTLLYRAMGGRATGTQMMWRFTDVVAGLIAEEVPRGTAHKRVVRFICGGIIESLHAWIEDGCRDSPQKLAREVRKLAAAAAS